MKTITFAIGVVLWCTVCVADIHQAIQAGVAYLHAQVDAKVDLEDFERSPSVEWLMLSRVCELELSREAMPQAAESGDIVSLLCSRDLGVNALEQWRLADGAFPAEKGSHGDIPATCMASWCLMEHRELYDAWSADTARWLVHCRGEDGLWHLPNDVDSDTPDIHFNAWMVLLDALNDRFQKQVEADSRARVFLFEYLNAKNQDNDWDDGIYDLALLVQAETLLESPENTDQLIQTLLQKQEPTGAWTDETVEDSNVVTACVIVALKAFERRKSLSTEIDELAVGVRCISNLTGDELPLDAICGKGELRLSLQGEKASFLCCSWGLADENGTCVQAGAPQPIQGEKTLTTVDYLVPGKYTLSVSVWDQETLVFIKRVDVDIRILSWFTLESFQLQTVGCGRIRMLNQVSSLTPVARLKSDGNTARRLRVMCRLLDSEDKIHAVFPEVTVDISGESRCDLDAVFSETDVTFDKVGYYQVEAEILAEDGERLAKDVFLMYINEKSLLEIETAIEPSVLPVGPQVGQYDLQLYLNGGMALSGTPVSFKADHAVVIDKKGETCVIRLTNLKNAQGKTLVSGWVIAETDYGRCQSGTMLVSTDDIADGSRSAHQITNGRCEIPYYPSGNKMTGAVSVRIYGALGYKSSIQQLDLLGHAQVLLQSEDADVEYHIFRNMERW